MTIAIETDDTVPNVLADPPNYGPQPARFGPRCDLCSFYDQSSGMCSTYHVPVKAYYSCDSWKRDPGIPPQLV